MITEFRQSRSSCIWAKEKRKAAMAATATTGTVVTITATVTITRSPASTDHRLFHHTKSQWIAVSHIINNARFKLIIMAITINISPAPMASSGTMIR